MAERKPLVLLGDNLIGEIVSPDVIPASSVGPAMSYIDDPVDAEELRDALVSAGIMSPPVPVVPENVVAPVVTGAAAVNDPAFCSTGTWTGSPTSYAYQWFEFVGGMWTALVGETTNTFTPTATGQFRCEVTASNIAGTSDPEPSNSVIVSSGSWRTADEWTGTAYEDWSGDTIRQVIDSSVIGGAASQVRLRFTNGPYYDLSILAYVGVGASSGNEYAFDGTPVAVTVGSSTAINIVNDGANFLSATSDDLTLSVPTGRNLVVAMYMSGAMQRPAVETAQLGWRSYYRLGINDIATVAATGYTSNTTHDATVVSRVEVYG